MLMDSLARFLMTKEFEDISVKEIADEATASGRASLVVTITPLRLRGLNVGAGRIGDSSVCHNSPQSPLLPNSPPWLGWRIPARRFALVLTNL